MSEYMVSSGKTMKRHSLWYSRARFILGFLMMGGIVLATMFRVPFSSCVFLRLESLILTCPLGALEVNLAGRAAIWQMLPGFLIVAGLIFVLGRAWCGWFCPASLTGYALTEMGRFMAPGLTGKAEDILRETRQNISAKMRIAPRHVLGFLLGLLLGSALFQYPFWSIICPLGTVSRSLIQVGAHFSLRWDLVFLLLPLLAGMLFRFGWKCACPVGLVHGIIASGGKTMQPAPDPGAANPCNKCGVCAKVCPSGLHPGKSSGFGADFSSFECGKCLRCVEHCPRNALHLDRNPGGKGP